MNDPEAILRAAGWLIARQRKHRVWKCPCGRHQIVTSVSGSDAYRGNRNKLRDIRHTGCPSLEPYLHRPTSTR